MTTVNDFQLKILLAPVNPKRVGQVRGMAHMEAWDIRRQLIRVFGFGGYSTETLALDLVAERETKNGDRSRWTVVYRAQVRLTVYDGNGNKLGSWDDGAAGDSVNQPSLGDAHDMAMKTALSQALKRCATNLGDQFGLSLYNNGSTEAVVSWSAAHPPKAQADQPDPMPELNADPKVQPEQEPQPSVRAVPDTEGTPAAEATTPDAVPVDEWKEALTAMWEAAKAVGFEAGLPQQFESTFGHAIDSGTLEEFRQARDLMTGGAAA